MIKFTASGEGIILVGLGLEPENIKRMQAGQPIRVRLSDLGFTGALGSLHVILWTGESVEDMQKAIAPFIDSNTVVHR